MVGGFLYCFLYCVCFGAMSLWHPCFRVIGRENVPKNEKLVICANHSGMADPFWILFALRLGHIPHIMAKKEVFSIPVIKWIIRKVGVIGVDREGADVNAIKQGMRVLRDGHQLLVFPEGTRIKNGKESHPKRGAMLLASRTQSQILPVYLSVDKKPFRPLTCVIGKPYQPDFGDARPTDAQLQQETDSLMEKIYKMGEAL